MHETVSDFNDEYNKELQCPGLPNEITIQADDQRENTKEQYPPEYSKIGIPTSIEWGKSDNGSSIFIQTSTLINAYDEVILWKKMFSWSLMGK